MSLLPETLPPDSTESSSPFNAVFRLLCYPADGHSVAACGSSALVRRRLRSNRLIGVSDLAFDLIADRRVSFFSIPVPSEISEGSH
ncbi:unnamed protein product [Linum trigynum]|uniref:Uncharacterized protein n=1 Tax=Linum trigynum TaxID=586398 RepID=A0AAV2CHR5_9ROSI